MVLWLFDCVAPWLLLKAKGMGSGGGEGGEPALWRGWTPLP